MFSFRHRWNVWSRAEFVMKAMKTTRTTKATKATKGNVREKKRFRGELINEILLDRKRGFGVLSPEHKRVGSFLVCFSFGLGHMIDEEVFRK